MNIRKATEGDRPKIEKLHRLAFGEEEGTEIVELVRNLLADKTAEPLYSLAAVDDGGELAGHILFTRAEVERDGKKLPLSVQLLAPLGVSPGRQGQGVGGLLIKEGLRMLEDSGVQLVFVLGHPEYYPRFGFRPAGVMGLDAPYPILERNAGAWMVQELFPGVIGRIMGVVKCAAAIDKPQYWRE